MISRRTYLPQSTSSSIFTSSGQRFSRPGSLPITDSMPRITSARRFCQSSIDVAVRGVPSTPRYKSRLSRGRRVGSAALRTAENCETQMIDNPTAIARIPWASERLTSRMFQAMILSIGLPKSISSRLWPGTSSLRGVEAELVQHRGVDVGDVVPVLDRVEADLVRRAVDDAALDPAAGHPDREAVGVVVAAVASSRRRACGRTRSPRRRACPPACPLRLRSASSPAIGLSTRALFFEWLSFSLPWASQPPPPPPPS